MKMTQDRCIVSIKVEWEVLCALLSGYMADDVGWPQTTQIFAFFITVYVFAVGQCRNFDYKLHERVVATSRDPFLPRDSYAKRGICRCRVSVCVSLSVCVSVTLRYCIKTAKCRIAQIMPHHRPGTLVFKWEFCSWTFYWQAHRAVPLQ